MCSGCFFLLFFFKQKTADEMRISDWSSDVCSSDLRKENLHSSWNERVQISALKKACGYLLNAKIDLETGAPKRTAIATIDGGLKMIREAIALAEQEQSQ